MSRFLEVLRDLDRRTADDRRLPTFEECGHALNALLADVTVPRGRDQRIVGQERLLRRILMGVLLNQNVLVTAVPGVAKTRSVAWLAEATGLLTSRIQLVPDLLPGDIIGAVRMTRLPGARSMSIRWRKGPIFAQLVLLDEINRAGPRTQAATMEALAERQVTATTGSGRTYPVRSLVEISFLVRSLATDPSRRCMGLELPDPSRRRGIQFTAVGTRNPLEQEGTYPLPEAQIDRFLCDVHVDLPPRGVLKQITDQLHSCSEKLEPAAVHAAGRDAAVRSGADDTVAVAGPATDGYPDWLLSSAFFRACRSLMFDDSERSLLARLKAELEEGTSQRRPRVSALETMANIVYFSTPRKKGVAARPWYTDGAWAEMQMELKLVGPRLARKVRALHARPEFDQVVLGASPRAYLHLVQAAMAEATLNGRSDRVTPHDIRSVCHDVMRSRIQLKPSAPRRGVTPDLVVDLLLDTFVEED